MEANHLWGKTLGFAALALAVLGYALHADRPALAASTHTSACQEVIPPEGVSALSTSDPIRLWMNEQLASGRSQFIVVHRGQDNRATVLCSW